jgi:peptidoglycan biosynthesis protein MviN/MurJ (putative lipid II flippase)
MEHDEQRSRRLRSAASVALPTLARRLLGYVWDLLQAYFLGPGHSADAFTPARLSGSGREERQDHDQL